MATSLTRVKGEVKANTIFDLTFDARQKCRKSNFSSRVITEEEKARVFKEWHSAPFSGHAGRDNTFAPSEGCSPGVVLGRN